MENKIKCELCGLICSMQVSYTHLRAKHDMTTKEYRALGYKTLTPARLKQLRQSPVGSGKVSGVRGKFGPDHPNWKGGHVTGAGYRVISRKGRRNLYEHRVVMEKMLERSLTSDEVVHHKDGKRSNNSPDNLELMTRKQHDQNKDGTKRYFNTGPLCEEAAKALHEFGWSISKIGRAIRVDHRTVSRWLSKSD